MGRRVGLLACAVVSVAALLPAGALANGTRQSHHSAALTVDLGILQQLNQIRRAHHLAPLTLSPNLNAAARQHSRDMLARGYFAHNSADGSPFWKRIKSFYPEPRYGYWSVGENLFWASGSVTADGSMKAWMASPASRQHPRPGLAPDRDRSGQLPRRPGRLLRPRRHRDHDDFGDRH